MNKTNLALIIVIIFAGALLAYFASQIMPLFDNAVTVLQGVL